MNLHDIPNPHDPLRWAGTFFRDAAPYRHYWDEQYAGLTDGLTDAAGIVRELEEECRRLYYLGANPPNGRRLGLFVTMREYDILRRAYTWHEARWAGFDERFQTFRGYPLRIAR